MKLEKWLLGSLHIPEQRACNPFPRAGTFWCTCFTQLLAEVEQLNVVHACKSYLLFLKTVLIVQTNESLSLVNFPEQLTLVAHFVRKFTLEILIIICTLNPALDFGSLGP